MEDNVHDVVKLLLARMESHPEEFKRSLDGRWYNTMGDINEWGNEADKAAINAKLRDIRLNEAHEDAMDELCNGPDRRRKAAEEIEYERQLIMQRGAAQQQAAQKYAQQYAQTGGSFGAPIKGASTAGTWIDEAYNTTKPLTTSRYPASSDMESNGIMNALRNILK